MNFWPNPLTYGVNNTSGSSQTFHLAYTTKLPKGNWAVYAEWNDQIGQTLNFTIS